MVLKIKALMQNFGVGVNLQKDEHSRTSMARISLESQKFIRDMGSSSHWGLLMVPGREAEGR